MTLDQLITHLQELKLKEQLLGTEEVISELYAGNTKKLDIKNEAIRQTDVYFHQNNNQVQIVVYI